MAVTKVDRCGAWDARHGHLRGHTELDCGHRLIIADPQPVPGDIPGRAAYALSGPFCSDLARLRALKPIAGRGRR